jgi:hypothetical protein
VQLRAACGHRLRKLPETVEVAAAFVAAEASYSAPGEPVASFL